MFRFLAKVTVLFCIAAPVPREPAVAKVTTCPAPFLKTTRNCVAAIRGGDLVKPAFSPSGRYLAFATVTLPPGDTADELSELDGTLVADLQKSQVRILIQPEAARKYASYSAFVCRIRWRSDQLLIVTYCDGDVEADQLMLRLRDAKILAVEHLSLDDDPPQASEASEDSLSASAVRKLVPGMPLDEHVEEGYLSPGKTRICVVVDSEPHRQLIVFTVHPSEKS